MKNFSKTALMIALLGSAVFVSSCKDDDGGSKWTDAEITALEADTCDGLTDEECDCIVGKITSEWSSDEYNNFDDDDADELLKFLSFIDECDITLSF